MAVLLLLLVIFVSYTAVHIGAVALELTGIPWDVARFQALSAFSNCGFTTRESEDVTRHPVRRRIVSYLIIFGNAGIVTTIGTFASSMVQGNLGRTLINVGAIAAGLTLILWIARRQGVTDRIRRSATRWLSKRYKFTADRADELLRLHEGYGLTRIKLEQNSPAIGQTLKDLSLKDHLVQVLAIERDSRYMPIPRGDDKLCAHDRLIVYGDENQITAVFAPESEERLTLTTMEHTQ